MAAMDMGNYPGYPAQNIRENMRLGHLKIVIGASGATGGTGESLPAGFTVTKNTTGLYDVTFPPAKTIVFFGAFVQFSTTPTVSRIYGKTAVDQTGGTWQFATCGDTQGTPVEPASGDVLVIEFAAQWASVA
jgi:hypothetical protein